MQRLVLIFCILVLTSVSHISAQSCTTSEQCIDAELAPICRNGACSPCNESLSQECLDRSPNAPICSVGGCYACITSGSYATECGILFPSTPICVNDTGACRTCTADSECTIYGETVNCQDGACIGLDENSGLIIAVCFIAAIVAVIIALILYARLRKKKSDKKGTTNTSTNNAANNMNNNNASMKGSARNQSGTNKDVPMTDMAKEPITIDGSHSREDSSDSSEVSSSKGGSAPQKSGSSEESSSESEESAEDSSSESSESSSASSSEGAQQSSHESSAQSSS